MTYDTFRKAERIQRQIRDFKALIGESDNGYLLSDKHIQAAEDDEEIKAIIHAKINLLQAEFEAL